jgi:hypothetical protein
VQFAIGDAAVGFLGAVGLPQDGDLVAAGGQMAIQRVGGEVERAVGKPLDAEIVLVERFPWPW